MSKKLIAQWSQAPDMVNTVTRQVSECQSFSKIKYRSTIQLIDGYTDQVNMKVVLYFLIFNIKKKGTKVK